jgi:hypothetical protein
MKNSISCCTFGSPLLQVNFFFRIDHAKHLTGVTYIKFIVVSPVNFVALVRITVLYFVENL